MYNKFIGKLWAFMPFAFERIEIKLDKNKVTITINNREYTLMSEDNEQHLNTVAEYIDKKIAEIVMASGGKLTLQDVSVLAAINVADDYLKSEETADNLRSQIKQYIDDASSASFENNRLKAEISRLKAELAAVKGMKPNV